MRTIHILGILVLLALAVPAPPAHAGGIVSVCDEAHLRAALAGGGTVTFACSGTITLTAEITIAADTTVDGSGQAVTISGNNAVRVFQVNSGVAFNLNELTVTNGSADYDADGGGIRNGGTLIVSNCTFTDNSANMGGGIYNVYGGTVTVSNSTFIGNRANNDWTSSGGGGIYNFGTLSVSNSTFTGNYGGYGGGGGIHTVNSLTVRSSTFSGNSAGTGGGIYLYDGTLAVSNSTFSGNSAGSGGGIANVGYGTAMVTNGTFSGNSGGIYTNDSFYSTTTLKNTIVANNEASGNCTGAVIDGGGNLSYPDTTCPGINADPFLGPLQNNGGPTWTMALGPGSAALDAADDAICAAAPVNNLDQRGVTRPWGSHCDIGAVEQRIVSVCDDAHLRSALAGGGMITFSCSGTITLTNTIAIAADTTIDGSGQNVTISGNHIWPVFRVNAGVMLNLNELTVANGNADHGHGGGIYNYYGTVTVSNSTFSGNSATYGGGIDNSFGTVIVSNSTFSGNSATYGGGISNAWRSTVNATLTVSNSTFSNNSASSWGGGISNSYGATLTVSNSTFSDNSAGIRGGGIDNSYGATLTVSNSTLSDNSAPSGGGIENIESTVMLKNAIVANSPAGGNCYGTITDGGGNLSYLDTTCPGINRNPKLGILQNNGGPTWTMALGPGSAAIDAGIDAICAAPPVNGLDQRGASRPLGSHCDIGAVEQQPYRKTWFPTIRSE